jgi:hypothetical protein
MYLPAPSGSTRYRRGGVFEVKQKIEGRCSMILMTVLVNLLRERYSGFVFTLNRGVFLWELRCFEDHRERWCLRGRKTEIEREMRYLLDTARDPMPSV